MKKILTIAAFTAILGSGCQTSRLTPRTDDVYANPVEEKKLAQQAALEKAKQEAEERHRQEESATAQKEKDAANPRFNDPKYQSDDYYDYEYASRINRFQRPLYGAGYYDPYYTNIYTYNQNPAMYGTSIYSSYFYGMPSGAFSYGIGIGYGQPYYGWNNCYYGNNFYDPWCNNYGYYNSWNYPYGWYNNAYANGYYNGYYNGLNNAGWGYYNIQDPNSGYSKPHYAPRGSNGGGNNANRTEPGMAVPDNSAQRGFFESGRERQNNNPRFSGNSSQGTFRSSSPGSNQPEPDKNYNQNQNNQYQQPTNRPRRVRENESTPNMNQNNQGRNNQGTQSPRNSGGGGNSRRR